MYIKYFLLIFFSIKIISNKDIPKTEEVENIITAHLNNVHIQILCKNINTTCDIDTTNLCAVRKINNNYEYKYFENSCFLFMENMCYYPGNEYYIVQSGACNTRRNWFVMNTTDSILSDNTTARRVNMDSSENVEDKNKNSPDNEADENTNSPDNVADENTDSPDNVEDENTNSPDNVEDENTDSPDKVGAENTNSPDNVLDENTNSTENEADRNTNSTDNEADGNTNSTDNIADENTKSSKPSLRAVTKKFKPLYDVDESFDGHICPLSCADIYEPMCVQANRAYGKYLKFWTFVNHCEADVYYCKHSDEFGGPASDSSPEEDVTASLLGWSLCASSRYFSFSRFVEAASSLGHYGWLDGNRGATKILEPNMRKPGYG